MALRSISRARSDQIGATDSFRENSPHSGWIQFLTKLLRVDSRQQPTCNVLISIVRFIEKHAGKPDGRTLWGRAYKPIECVDSGLQMEIQSRITKGLDARPRSHRSRLLPGRRQARRALAQRAARRR